ncbi:MAG: hypothetical protein AAB621_03360 [Patescibacteria group bacterium]
MRKKILNMFLLWLVLMIFAGALGFLLAKTDESAYGLLILVVGIIIFLFGVSFLHRFAGRQYSSKLKPNVVYKTLISMPSDMIGLNYYYVIIREQNGGMEFYCLDKKPPDKFKYTGDINNPYEIISP